MKGLKNKKGFTLIELLAVIVVLAIVTVIASSSILPYMSNAGKDAFVSEANIAIDGASNAMSLISLGNVSTDNYKSTSNADGTTTYCFTLDNLKSLSLWDKDDSNYAGKVEVTVPASGYSYTYTVTMHNKDYYVNGSGTITNDALVDYDADGTHKNISFGC